jgi:hypothetical protein
MLRFIAEAYGPLAVQEAWRAFTGDDDLEYDPDTPLLQLFMPWFFLSWTPDRLTTEVVAPPTEAYRPRGVSSTRFSDATSNPF